jgi:nitrate reductase beta subunit
MRRVNLGDEVDPAIAARVGMTVEQLDAMYRLLAIAKYDDRYVVPTAHNEAVASLRDELPGCSVDWSATGDGARVVGDGKRVPVAIESFRATKKRQEAEKYSDLDGPR